MKNMDRATQEQLHANVYLLAGLHDGVEMVRAECLPGSEDMISSMELLKMIRAAYCDPDEVITDITSRINADEAAIKLALLNSDSLDFANRLAAKAGS